MRLQHDSASGYRFAAIATLSAAAAGITLLSGLLDLRLFNLRITPLISVRAVPDPTWSNTWLGAAQSARSLQNEAVAEWLQLVGTLLLAILAIAGISALVALFAHATARRYETALSAVVGATRKQITIIQLRKAAFNAGAALLIGVSVGLLTASVAHRAWPDTRAPMSASGWIVMSTLFCCGLAAFVAHRVAARMSHAGWLGDVLAPEARTNPGFGAEDLRGVLLHLQFAVTFALLAVALMVGQHARSTTLPMANRPADNLYVTQLELDQHSTEQQRRALYEQLQSYAVATPGTLIGVGATDQIVSNCGRCVVAYMMLPMFPLRTQQHVVGERFFERVGFELQYGREFEPTDRDKRHVVVNDTFAHLAFQGQHPIGKQIQVGGLRGDWYTVIGVIEDVPITGLLTFNPGGRSVIRSTIPGHEPAIYFYTGDKPPAVVQLIADKPIALNLAGIRVTSSTTLQQLMRNARAPARWFGGVLGMLALAAAVIAVLSLGAITLLNVRQRELEIAARRAVGARRRDIVRMVLGGTATTVARGAFVGLILSMAVARAIQMILPQMKLFDPWVIAATAGALALISLIAAVVPARAAASVAPAQIHA